MSANFNMMLSRIWAIICFNYAFSLICSLSGMPYDDLGAMAQVCGHHGRAVTKYWRVLLVVYLALCYVSFLNYGFWISTGNEAYAVLTTLRRRAVFYVEADLSARPLLDLLLREYRVDRCHQGGDPCDPLRTAGQAPALC